MPENKLCSAINSAIDLCERIKRVSRLRFSSGESANISFDACKGKFMISASTDMGDSSIRWGVKDVKIDDQYTIPQAELLLRKKSVFPVAIEYDIQRLEVQSRELKTDCKIYRLAIIDEQDKTVDVTDAFGGEQRLSNGETLPMAFSDVYSFGIGGLERVRGIQFIDGECQVRVIPYRKRLIIVAEGVISRKEFNDTVRKLLMIIGFVTGYCPINYFLTFQCDSTFSNMEWVDFDGQLITKFDTRFKLLGDDSVAQATKFSGDNIVALLEKLRTDELFSDIFYRYCEVVQDGVGLSHIVCSEVLAAVMEACARHYSRDKPPMKLLSSVAIESALLKSVKKAFVEFKKLHPGEDALKYKVIENRISNIIDHNEGSTKQLERAFGDVNLGMSLEKIKQILRSRNTLLHGTFGFKSSFDINSPQAYIEEAESHLYRMVYLIGAYILVMLGFDGDVRDIEKEHLDFLKAGQVRCSRSFLLHISPSPRNDDE